MPGVLCSHARSARKMTAASAPNLHRCLAEEFQRLAKRNRDYLTLDDLLALRLPPSAWPVTFSHLGVLHAMDR